MAPERWQQVERIFNEALVHTEDQSQFLDVACKEDSSLRQEIAQLLPSASEDDLFLDRPAVTWAIDEAQALSAASGAIKDWCCGPYRLLRLIGSGGMGSVYEAQRVDGEVEQRVAIKLLRFNADDPAFRRRFLQERQILASLSHPAIARLIDAGHSADQQPYLVMEYIDGTPIDEYAEKLDVRGKLRLFRQVCDAVSYAHRNLIVHRDLKPSNILVDKEGQPKLLDFGIAKMIDTGLDQEQTAPSLRALTPSYASPEQIRGQSITTSSDVYSLGVLLYKLLAGRFPYEFKSLTPVVIDNTICEVEAAPPGLGQDIDNILLMALRKEPSRRYASVQQLADDIDRLLSNHPVMARPSTIGYQAGKFFRRHRYAVTAAVLVLSAISAELVISLYQARLQQQRFQDVRALAHTFLFDVHDQLAKLEGSTKARERMVRTGLEYLNTLARNGAGDPDLQQEIAAGYTKLGDAQGNPNGPNLGRIEDALASYRKAAEIYEHMAATSPVYLIDLGRFYLQYAALVRFNRELPRARELSESAIKTFERMHSKGVWDSKLASSYETAWCTVGDMDEDMGRNREAWISFSRCRDLAREQVKGDNDLRALEGLGQADERIATAASELGRLKEALQALDEDEAVLGKLLASEPRNPKFRRRRALVDSYRASVFFDDADPSLGDPDRALESSQRYLKRTEEMVRGDPSNTSAQLSRAIALFEVSFSLREFDPKAAVDMAKDSLRKFDDLIAVGKSSYLVTSRRLRALQRLGEAQIKAGEVRDAGRSAELLLAATRPMGSGIDATAQQRAVLVAGLMLAGKVDEANGRFKRAEDLFLEAREDARRLAANGELENIVQLANVEETLGGFYVRRHSEQARVCYQRLLDLWQGYPERNEYVEGRQLAVTRLLASLNASRR